MSLAEKSFEPDAACPLDGVRVIDLSRLVAGNAVSSQLADFGAEVLKIEDPQKGDPLRAWQTGGVSVHWKLYARNKKSVALSLRDERGRELLLGLGAGRALSRPPGHRDPRREHVGLCRAHRLCRPRAGAAADRARRHGGRAL